MRTYQEYKEILSTEQGRKRFAELLEQDNP